MARFLRPARRGSDAGFTLVEILITVALLGGVMTAMLGAVTVATRVSGSTAQGAQVEGEARRIAELLRSKTIPFGTCPANPPGATVADYYKQLFTTNPTLLNLPAGLSYDIPKVEWGSWFSGDAPNFHDQTCPDTTPEFQRITVTVCARTTCPNPPVGISSTVAIVKRNLQYG